MRRAGTWVAPEVEPNWQETPRYERRNVSKGKNAPRHASDSITAAEVCLLMLRWRRPKCLT